MFSRENERLLLNILPASIAERLRGGERVIADRFDLGSAFDAAYRAAIDCAFRVATWDMVRSSASGKGRVVGTSAASLS